MRGKHGHHARGQNHPRWRGGVAVSSHGYLKVQVGKEHPLADPNGYAYAHVLVWVAAGNEKPRANESLHHTDEDKRNNRIENLELLTRSDHATHHTERRQRDQFGRMTTRRLPPPARDAVTGRMLGGKVA